MRTPKSGYIVNLLSIAGQKVSAGAVDTELLQGTKASGVAECYQQFYETSAISADLFAHVTAFPISRPEDVDINEIRFRPTRKSL